MESTEGLFSKTRFGYLIRYIVVIVLKLGGFLTKLVNKYSYLAMPLSEDLLFSVWYYKSKKRNPCKMTALPVLLSQLGNNLI